MQKIFINIGSFYYEKLFREKNINPRIKNDEKSCYFIVIGELFRHLEF